MIAVFVDEQGIWLAVLCPSAVSMGELHSKLLMDLKGRVQEIHEVIGRNHFKQSFHLCTVSAALTSSGIYSQLNSKWLPACMYEDMSKRSRWRDGLVDWKGAGSYWCKATKI